MITKTTVTWSSVFKEHTEASWDTLYRFAFSLTKNEPEAEDLVQSSLIKGLSSFPLFVAANYQLDSPERTLEFSQKTDLTAFNRHILNWMMKITKNTFLDERNRLARKLTHVPLADWDEEPPSDVKEPIPSLHPNQNSSLQEMEQQFFEQALDDDWKTKFAVLNAKQRSVLFLTAEDYTYKEIAQLLDIPIGTVMSTLNRALKKLKS